MSGHLHYSPWVLASPLCVAVGCTAGYLLSPWNKHAFSYLPLLKALMNTEDQSLGADHGLWQQELQFEVPAAQF